MVCEGSAPEEILRQFTVKVGNTFLNTPHRQLNHPIPNVCLLSMGSIQCPMRYLNTVGVCLTFQLLQSRA